MAGVARPSVRNQTDPFSTPQPYVQPSEPLPTSPTPAGTPADQAANYQMANGGAPTGAPSTSFAPVTGGVIPSTPPNATATTVAPTTDPAAAMAGLQAANPDPGMTPLNAQSSLRPGLGQRNPPSLQGLLQVRTY